jgi:hypothetical protein
MNVSCLGLGSPGTYDVVARVIDAGGEETDVGRLRVEIVSWPSSHVSTPEWLWRP